MSDGSTEDMAIPKSVVAVLERRYEELRQFAARRAGSLSMADDIMQDAWLRLTSDRCAPQNDVDAVRNPLAYLYRVIANLVIDRQRQRAAQERHVVAQDIPESIVSDLPSPFQVVADQQEYALLQQAIRSLPDKCRQVFLLYRARDMTMQQIAAHLGISPKTVENHLARAMVHCRQQLRAAGRAV